VYGAPVNVCWLPDGSGLALILADARTKEGSIVFFDLDGSNFRKLPLPPGRWNLYVCDWKSLTPGLKAGAPDEPPDLKTPQDRYQALLREVKTQMKQAEVVFERTVQEIGDETGPHRDSLRDDARAELYEIRELSVRKPAPEIVGQDIDGKPFKLSEFTGKVVVIDFWTMSCGSCRSCTRTNGRSSRGYKANRSPCWASMATRTTTNSESG
jgi:hypothetical protein